MAKHPTTKDNKPTQRLYVVNGDGKDAFWQQIGAAWPHQDGEGFDIVLDALPVGGRMVMRQIEEKPAR